MPGKLFKMDMTPEPPEAPSMLEPEWQPHYDAWKANPGPKTNSAMMKAVRPVLDSALRTYGGSNPSPTLQSKAKILAMQAIERYDPQRAKLRTHLMSHLQGLRRLNAQETQIIGIPERIGLDQHRLRESERELQDKLGRPPSTSELADHTGLSARRIGKIRQVQPGVSEGMTTAISGDSGEEDLPTGPAVVSGEGEKLWQNFIYHDLPPQDQLIMEHTLGLHGKPVLPKQRVAQLLGLSPGAVSQRAARIQERLDQRESIGGAFFGG